MTGACDHVVRRHRDVVTVTLPLRLTNPLNGSWGHWRVAAAKRKAIRIPVALALRGPLRALMLLLMTEETHEYETSSEGILAQRRPVSKLTQVSVKITRIAPRNLDRHDGLPASAKPVVDAVAECLFLDDADPRLVVTYAQERGKPRQYGVRIEVSAA